MVTKIDKEYFEECFDIDEMSFSKLRWKERPREHFKNQHAWERFNKRYAGIPAGNKDRNSIIVNFSFGKIAASKILWCLAHGNLPAVVAFKDGNPFNLDLDNLLAFETKKEYYQYLHRNNDIKYAKRKAYWRRYNRLEQEKKEQQQEDCLVPDDSGILVPINS